jgi:glutaminase
MAPNPTNASAIQELLEEVHGRYRGLSDGAVANYIPELARADPDGFGLALATADGRLYAVGDTDVPFTIQSISKPFAYGLALQLLSEEHMQRKVGVEPSGEAFNAISLDPTTGIPRNPMINAGAIATTAQIRGHAGEAAEEQLLAFFSALAGHPLQIDPAVYASERDTGHRNRAISHLLRNANVIEEEPELGLDLYFRQCAISVTCRDLAVMAATLACQGRNPFTGAQPLTRTATTRLLALMGTCGMYDYAGHWLHNVGMPAKSGVAGGVLAVVPGRLGLAIWSPRLDRFGNSVRGIAVCEELSRRLELHLYDQNPASQNPIRRCTSSRERQSRRWRPPAEVEQLAAAGERLQVLQAQGVLDFAASEQLLARLERIAATADLVVLDLARVIGVPASCLPMLARQFSLLAERGITLLLCRAEAIGSLSTECGGVRWFPNLDLALEAGEDALLAQISAATSSGGGADVSDTLLDRLSAEHRGVITPLLVPCQFAPGETVMRRGDCSEALFIARDGLFETTLSLDGSGDGQGRSRLATFSPGMCFGEIGFLTGQPRSADVVCQTGGHCWQLARASFTELQRRNPETAIQLLVAILAELGVKLARTSQQLSLIENL